MRILIAPDKFKSTLSAAQAARAMRDGALAAITEIQADPPAIELLPLADGGEGSHDCLRELSTSANESRLQLREADARLADPNGVPQTVPYLISTEAETSSHAGASHRYLETALAIGLTLPDARAASILDRTTRGVGEWISANIAEHASKNADPRLELHLFLGGSATSDGGFGLARAVGFRLYDARGDEVRSFRDTLNARRIEPPTAMPVATAPERMGGVDPANPPAIVVHVYTDVQNPLDGPTGAARLFGPQKGASAAEVEELEKRLSHLGGLFEAMRRQVRAPEPGRTAQASGKQTADGPAFIEDREKLSTPLYRQPGAGAAGGLALPLLYWPGVAVRFRSGIDFFLEAANLEAALRERQPDCLISGEGATDRGSLQGKVVAGLGRLLVGDDAPPLLIVSGAIPADDRVALAAAGFANLYDTNTVCGPRWPLSPDEAADRLRRTTNHALRDFLMRPSR